MLYNVVPVPVPRASTWLSCHAQLFHPPELPQPGSRALSGNYRFAPHVVGAVYGEKIGYAAAHGGQEPPPDVVSKLTTEREKTITLVQPSWDWLDVYRISSKHQRVDALVK